MADCYIVDSRVELTLGLDRTEGQYNRDFLQQVSDATLEYCLHTSQHEDVGQKTS